MKFTPKTFSKTSFTVPKSSWENHSQPSIQPTNTTSEETSISEKSLNPNIFSVVALVTWVDAASHGGPGWVELIDAHEFAQASSPLMKTIGYVLYYDPEPDGWISMTDTLGDEECSNIHKIPSCMIRSMEMLPCNKLM